VDIDTCDYLLDLDFPEHPRESTLEPRYATDTLAWERVTCVPFLDAAHSPLLTRALWAPGARWRELNEYGDYCLLRSTKLAGKLEQMAKRLEQEKTVPDAA
jgi:alpha-1,2-mannosyltransferase